MKHRLYIHLLILIAFTFVMSSCSKKNILFRTDNEKNLPNIPVHELKQGDQSFSNRVQIIQPGDLLSINNLQNELLINGGVASGKNASGNSLLNQSQGQTYRVESDGNVIVPVLGKIKLGGLNRIEAQDLLNNLLKKELLKDPLITIAITNSQITFLGEFNKQGNFTLVKDQNHLVQLIGEAGGFTNRANKRKVKIIRGDLNNPEVFVVNLEDIAALSNPKLNIQNNDIVYAEPRKAFQILDRLNPATSFLGVAVTLGSLYILIDNLNK